MSQDQDKWVEANATLIVYSNCPWCGEDAAKEETSPGADPRVRIFRCAYCYRAFAVPRLPPPAEAAAPCDQVVRK
jgi:hypothetical protein